MSKLYDSIGQFATIPYSIIKLVPSIGADSFTLWSYLRSRTNGETGDAFPSYDTIRKDLGDEFHSRKVAGCIRILMQFDLLDRKKRFGNSNIYNLKSPTPQNPQENTVLSTGKGKVFQRVKTNKIDINKIDINNTVSTAETEISEIKPPYMPSEAKEQWDAIPSASKIETVPSSRPTLSAELPDEIYLFNKINETRGLKGRMRSNRFATIDQKDKFRKCIAFYNGHCSEMIDRVMANGRGDVSAVVNAIAWHMQKDSKTRLNTLDSPTGMGHLPLYEATR